MIYVMLGPPLSGKGTQSQIIKDRLNATHVTAGDLLRKEIQNRTALGNAIKEVIDNGNLVSDHQVFSLVDAALKVIEPGRPIILDGFPRTIGQAELLFSIVNPQILKVFLFDAEKSFLLSRMIDRITCNTCGAVYNKEFNPPKKENTCDMCDSIGLVTRKDDRLDAFEQRIESYLQETKPLIDFFEKLGLLYKIDASKELTEVTQQILKEI